MRNLTHPPNFGFPADSKHEFYLCGRKHRVGHSGVRTLQLLGKIHATHSQRSDPGWLLPYRSRIRELWMSLGSRSVLGLVVERTDDPVLRLFAIWLRGRCGGHLGATSIARYWNHPDETTRKEVARTLKRLELWSHLRRMAELDQNERIRRIATTGPTRSFRERLSRFSRGTQQLPSQPINHPLVVSPYLSIDQAHPPKSALIIRMILGRIRQLVSAHSR